MLCRLRWRQISGKKTKTKARRRKIQQALKQPLKIPVEEASTLEDTLGIFLIEHEKLTSSLADLVQRVVNPPDLTLAAQTVLTAQLELGIDALLLERLARSSEDGGAYKEMLQQFLGCEKGA